VSSYFYALTKIANNTVGSPTITGAAAYPAQSAVAIGENSSFIMHGGEISNTNYGAVRVTGRKDKPAIFVMEDGVIKNNGKTGQVRTNNSAVTYPLGGGVYVSGLATFCMEGGEISDNGVDNMPGSGIYVIDEKNAPQKFILNGVVRIVNNTIALPADTGQYFDYVALPTIGSGFSTTLPIEVDLCAWEATEANFSTYWLGRQFFKFLDEGDDTVTVDSTLAGKFALTGYYKLTLNNQATPVPPPVPYADISYGIDDSGFVVDLAQAGD
jgi:hypothetical protein